MTAQAGWPRAALAAVTAAVLHVHPALAVNTGELVDLTELRVCADPSDLPFSNEKGEGFENKIAELVGAKLGVPVVYTWYPQSMGFVRNTLRANRCDLIIGVVAADELVQNTNPYYRSSYVLAVRSEDRDRFGDLDSPLMLGARIGVVAGTPPSDLLVSKQLIGQTRPYQLLVDTRVEQPARQMMDDLAKGEIDAALVWGPIAGYWAKQQSVPITLIPLASDMRSGMRMDFRISMGMRPGEPDWKHKINELIRELQPEITAILQSYGVPLLDGKGQVIQAASAEAAGPASSSVAEPEGYRMEQYRAPVPATLRGATVLGTSDLLRLIEEQSPVLVDVLPRQRKPKDRDPGQLWIEPKREDIPGSVWLPNVGFGELAPDFAKWFDAELAGLAGGDKGRPIVFYCDANCWMSWNAAKRAISELGYTNVFWYPEGVQGWKAGGRALVEAQARPMPDFAQ
ncbi:MAG: quinoprotein dehydrogenase-associated putative ABC transporter substrate-binding protein [Geminicoccaceae bacterium]